MTEIIKPDNSSESGSENSTDNKPKNYVEVATSVGKTDAGSRRLGWGAKAILSLSLLVALVAAGIAGYVFYLQQQKQIASLEERQTLLSQLQASTNQLTSLKSELGEMSQMLMQDRKAIQSANENRTLLQSRMATLEQEISQITGSHRIDWMLREVEHFITVAEQRLSLLGDARGALALLIEAEDIARAMHEPTARPLREALVKDINALKLASETQVDVDGLFARISDLISRVEKLGIPSYELFQEPLSARGGNVDPGDEVDFFLVRFKSFLDSLVRYQKHEKSKSILLSSQRDYLVQSVELLLNQAQLALLKGDNRAYQLSLNEARNRVDLYVAQQNEEAKFFVAEIGALSAVQIRPQVPTIEASNRAVRVFREFWNKEKLIREQQVIKLQQENAQ